MVIRIMIIMMIMMIMIMMVMMTMTAAIIVNRSQIGAQVLTQLSFCVASSQVAENGRRRWTVVAKKEFRGKRGCGQKEMGGRRGGHLPKKEKKNQHKWKSIQQVRSQSGSLIIHSWAK